MNNKILIIEDNKNLTDLITKNIDGTLNLDIKISTTLKETKKLLEDTNSELYNFAIISDKLLDANNGEAIEYINSNYNIPVIAFISNLDNISNFKNNIIDYVLKDSVNEVMYMISMISRMIKNKHHKALIIADSNIYRKKLKVFLENLLFKVIEVNDGLEALDVLEGDQERAKEIKLILTDYKLNDINEIELTANLRRKYNKNSMGIIAIPAENDPNIVSHFLRVGANDTMNRNFTKEEFNSRISNTLEALENIEKMQEAAYKDFLTGLYNRRYFFKIMDEYFLSQKNKSEKEKENFSLTMIDIDNFKKINDTYGHDIGDLVIKKLSDIINYNIKHSDVAARFGGEEFCLVLKDIDEENNMVLLNKIRQKIEERELKVTDENKIVKFTISIGTTFKIGNDINDMIKTADEFLYKAKETGKNKIVSDNIENINENKKILKTDIKKNNTKKDIKK